MSGHPMSNRRLWLLLWATWIAVTAASHAAQPNVVLILIDDLNHYGITAYGADRISEKSGLFDNQKFSTPNIDQLAKDGLRCDYAFAYPLCEPTRIALMSGQYNSRNFLRCKSQHASEITFGDLFQKFGYATGMFGKWKQTRGTQDIHAKDYIFQFGWDEFCCFDVVGERQRFINPNLVINGEIHNYEGRTDRDPHTGRRWYGPDICNRYALDFIDSQKDEPFFLYYPMLLVHSEHMPTPDTTPHRLFDECDESKETSRRFFPDMIQYMDKLVGKVVDKLDEHGLRKKTIIIVMGDNGTKEPFVHILPDGTKYAGGKGGNLDTGLHVPLIFNCPGTIPAGGAGEFRTYRGLVDVTDIYPTLCEAVGIKIPNPGGLDGISFWPQVCGAGGEPRKVIYTWYNGNNPATDLSNTLRYAFNRDFKRYAPHPNFPGGRFFDLRTDPLERDGTHQAKVHFTLAPGTLERVTSREKPRGWNHFYRSGLDVDKLSPEQRAAYEMLGNVLQQNEHVPVKALRIANASSPLHVGTSIQLQHEVIPANATRQNVIWKSSDPQVATINKFGELNAHAPGTATITVYSWDDANPTAARARETYSQEGIKANVTVEVK